MVQEGNSGTIFSEFLGPESLASSEFTRDSVIVRWMYSQLTTHAQEQKGFFFSESCVALCLQISLGVGYTSSQKSALIGRSGLRKAGSSIACSLRPHLTCSWHISPAPATEWWEKSIFSQVGQIPLLSLEGAQNPPIYPQAASGPKVKNTGEPERERIM